MATDILQIPLPVTAVATDEWDQLFRAHNRQVVLALIGRGIAPATARDLAQDAWLRIMQQHRNGRLQSLSLPGLVITQAMFLARDAARRSTARRPHLDITECELAVDMEQSLIDRDRLDRARRALGRCTPSQQKVFRAIYAQPGASASEVATATGLSAQRVRQILCEVRKKLRAVLEVEQ